MADTSPIAPGEPIAPDTPAETAPPPPSARGLSDGGVAALIFLAVFAVYGMTACRTIYTGDDGDFITAIVTTGIPHPTGYPLFCLLGKLFVFVLAPLGEPAFRINLMTAGFGAAAVAMTYRFFALLVPRRIIAAFAALLLAFTPTLWQQSLSCEVYSLTCLFLTTLLFQAKRWSDDPTDARRLKIMTVTYGLALTNHMTMALFFPAFLAFVVWKRRTLFREVGLLLTLAGLFVLPLILYAYLPLVAHFSDAPIKWGNPVTFDAFLAHLTGRRYRGWMFQRPLESLHKLPTVGGFLLHEFGWWFLWLAPVGWWALFRDPKNRPLNWVLTWVVGVDVIYAINYEIFDIYVYYLPTYIVFAAWVGVGMARALDMAWGWARASEETRARHARLLVPLLLAVTVVHVSLHYAETDKSDNRLESDFSANLLRTAPPNAILFLGRGNATFSVWYRQFVLGERPDVVCIDFSLYLLGDDGNFWYMDYLRRRYPALIAAFPNGDVHTFTPKVAFAALLESFRQEAVSGTGRPVLMLPVLGADDKAGQVLLAKFAPYFDLAPYGILKRLYPKGAVPGAPGLYAETAPLWDTYRTHGLERAAVLHPDPLQRDIPRTYALSYFALGQVAEAAGHFDVAAYAYDMASRAVNPFPEAEAARRRCEGRMGESVPTGQPSAPTLPPAPSVPPAR